MGMLALVHLRADACVEAELLASVASIGLQKLLTDKVAILKSDAQLIVTCSC
jgi:hypothetical protein